PLASERLGTRGAVAVRTFKTAGATAEDIEDRLVDRLGARDVTLTTLPGDGEVWVRLRARGRSMESAVKRLADVESTVTELLAVSAHGPARRAGSRSPGSPDPMEERRRSRSARCSSASRSRAR